MALCQQEFLCRPFEMPTFLIKKHIAEFATWLRNQNDYDDFEYGTEVIPGDKTWCQRKVTQPHQETGHSDDQNLL